MRKINHTKSIEIRDLALCITIAAVLGMGGFTTTYYMERKKARHEVARLSGEIRSNRVAQHTYVATAPEFTENRTLQKTMDSLKNRNIKMFCDAQDKYNARIDKKYPIGRFMNANQIARLNRIIMPYLHRQKLDNDTYILTRKITPLNSFSTLSEFQYVLQLANVPAEKFAPLDMIVNEGFLLGFNDASKEKLYESYLEELSRTYSDFNENEPNFDIPENALIRDEYMNNQHKISELNKKIESNNFLIAQTLARFGHINDSLNVLLEKNRQKLK